MDYNKDKLTKDKAETWKSFNKLSIYTIIFVAIILVILCFNQPTISLSVKKNSISVFAFFSESDP